MRVTIKTPSAVMGRVPRSQGIVEKDDFLDLIILLRHLEDIIIFDPLKIFESHRFIQAFVVISSQQVLSPFEALEDFLRMLGSHESKVSDDKDFILIRNCAVPILNELFVHSLDGLERSGTVFDDV